MCGIVAVIMKGKTGFFKSEEDVFLQMLYADALRGDDSTGVISVEKDTTFHINKEASEPALFIPAFRASKPFKTMFNQGKAYIGHNRKKTVGAIADDTAHPFVVDNEFALVHNGTLYNHENLAKNCKVDSEALAIHFKKSLDKDDIVAAFEQDLAEVRGAYATAMYHQGKDSIYFLRNKERPLSYVETNKAYFFASEGGLLLWVLSRNGMWTKETVIQQVPEHTLLTFDLNKGGMTSQELQVKKATPPATTVPMVVGGVTTKKDKLSKNQFKRFRRQLLGKKLEWWCDDFVETNFPRTEAEGETLFTLMGNCEEISHDHLIVASRVDKTKFNLADAEDATYEKWYGRVDDLDYDSRTGQVFVHMSEVSPLPFSIKKSSVEVVDAEYIKRKLDEQEKNSTALH